jgi:hypothetical protein
MTNRIVLALMARSSFEFVADISILIHQGREAEVQENFGFTKAEIDQAKLDREWIKVEYQEIRTTGHSMWYCEAYAKIAFLNHLSQGEESA